VVSSGRPKEASTRPTSSSGVAQQVAELELESRNSSALRTTMSRQLFEFYLTWSLFSPILLLFRVLQGCNPVASGARPKT